MSKSFVDQANVGAQNVAQHDVADPIVDRILMRRPGFLNEAAFHADLCGDRRHHAGMVRLNAADRNQLVGIGGDRVGHDIFELAQFVAAERQPGIAILAFGVKFDPPAEMRAEPRQPFDVGWAESQGITREFRQHAGASFLGEGDGRRILAPEARNVLSTLRRN